MKKKKWAETTKHKINNNNNNKNTQKQQMIAFVVFNLYSRF